MAKRTLESMVAYQGYADDVADRVIRSIREGGTEKDVLAGTKVLPHPDDAQRWHDTETAREDRERGQELRRRLPAAVSPEPPASPPNQHA